MRISIDEMISLVFYQGGELTPKEYLYKVDTAAFYRVKNAYEGINVLLFDGAENEKIRILQEKRTVDPVMLDYIDELLSVYSNIYSAMCKYTLTCTHHDSIYAHRCDRAQSLEALNQGKSASFMSTSLDKIESTVFRKKRGLLLLEVEAPYDTIHLDINAVLKTRSAYPNEQEILFAPFLETTVSELPMSYEEKDYLDIDNNPPIGKYKVVLKNPKISSFSDTSSVKELLLEKIRDDSLIENAKNVWSMYNNDDIPSEDMLNRYINWKKYLQAYLKIIFSEIYIEFFPEDLNSDRISQLNYEISVVKGHTNRRRIRYDKYLKLFNISLSLLQAFTVFFTAIIFLEIPEDDSCIKIAGLASVVLCLVIVRICKALSIEGKLKQRTATFLRLDELQTDIRFDSDLKKNIDRYIERYKTIVKEDNLQCEKNTEESSSFLDTLAKENNDIGHNNFNIK